MTILFLLIHKLHYNYFVPKKRRNNPMFYYRYVQYTSVYPDKLVCPKKATHVYVPLYMDGGSLSTYGSMVAKLLWFKYNAKKNRTHTYIYLYMYISFSLSKKISRKLFIVEKSNDKKK